MLWTKQTAYQSILWIDIFPRKGERERRRKEAFCRPKRECLTHEVEPARRSSWGEQGIYLLYIIIRYTVLFNLNNYRLVSITVTSKLLHKWSQVGSKFFQRMDLINNLDLFLMELYKPVWERERLPVCLVIYFYLRGITCGYWCPEFYISHEDL